MGLKLHIKTYFIISNYPQILRRVKRTNLDGQIFFIKIEKQERATDLCDHSQKNANAKKPLFADPELDPSVKLDEKNSVESEQTTPDDRSGQRKCRNQRKPSTKVFTENRLQRNRQQQSKDSVQNIEA